jgi:hypothetical protein
VAAEEGAWEARRTWVGWWRGAARGQVELVGDALGAQDTSGSGHSQQQQVGSARGRMARLQRWPIVARGWLAGGGAPRGSYSTRRAFGTCRYIKKGGREIGAVAHRKGVISDGAASIR